MAAGMIRERGKTNGREQIVHRVAVILQAAGLKRITIAGRQQPHPTPRAPAVHTKGAKGQKHQPRHEHQRQPVQQEQAAVAVRQFDDRQQLPFKTGAAEIQPVIQRADPIPVMRRPPVKQARQPVSRSIEAPRVGIHQRGQQRQTDNEQINQRQRPEKAATPLGKVDRVPAR